MFKTGDLITQRHQRDAQTKLVVGFTDNPDVLIAWDKVKGYHKVLAWSYDLHKEADAESLQEALARASSGDIELSPWFKSPV